jgi:ABC-type bacteriocin/lantibiotic exporter with double-glycine peptidase domain
LRRPQILLLDEPFSQLDGASATQVAAAIARLRGALTIVLVTHHLPAELACDRRIDLGTLRRYAGGPSPRDARG